ncbi:PAS domain S-box-containing protein [Xanthomonas sacchari]|nr:PAS domain S-box-containing protein [Xanthomonas sacchari]
MQTGKDITLRLMIVDDSGEDAEAIVSSLRNSGIAVRPSRPQHAEELAAMLASQPIDLVLSAQAQSIPLPQVLQRVAASGKDIPVIVLAERIEEQEWLEAMAGGARAIALRRRPEHLLAVVRTTWADLQARRGLRRIEAQMRETERRCDALIASSRDPIAYIHEGMHIRANDAYLEMFGFDSFDDVEGVSLLDMVAPQHVEGFKQLLKSLGKGEPPPAQYQVDARTLEGESFRGDDGVRHRQLRGRSLRAGGVPPPRGIRPGAGARGRGPAPTRPGHRPAQPPDLHAGAGDRRGPRRPR